MSEDWNEFFYLDPATPSGLRWKASDRLTQDDTAAGSLLREGRYSVIIRVDGKEKRRYCHRIVYEMNHSVNASGMLVDHFDGVPTNNLIGNLRLVTVSGNNRNRGRDSRNKTGTTGVTYIVVEGYPYYTAHWVDTKRRFKHFSVTKLGDAGAKAAAIQHRKCKIAELNAEGAGYTGRHGLSREAA